VPWNVLTPPFFPQCGKASKGHDWTTAVDRAGRSICTMPDALMVEEAARGVPPIGCVVGTDPRGANDAKCGEQLGFRRIARGVNDRKLRSTLSMFGLPPCPLSGRANTCGLGSFCPRTAASNSSLVERGRSTY